VPTKPSRVDVVKATPERYVMDIPLGRVMIEPDGVRFHRNGRGRGVWVVGPPESRAPLFPSRQDKKM
jgi:hypothetical protein